ncbi:MAG TPA: porin [Alphaproteobacteria bacterium]
MKKQLLSTSALVAAGMIATTGSAVAQAPASSPIQVTVGGYMYQFFSYTSQKDRNGGSQAGPATLTQRPVKFQVNSDSEIWFQGKTTLANGISVAMRVELEANTEADQIDESFAIVEGAFGRIEIGSTDNANYKMSIHAPEATIGTGVAGSNGHLGQLVANPTRQQINDSPFSNTLPRMGDNDSEKISYYTPRFEGFQLGFSYIPELTQDRAGLVPRFQSGVTYNRGIAFGVNFTRAFGPIDIAASGGWEKWRKPDPTAVSAFSMGTLSDPQAYNFGLQVGYAGFRVGGSYLKTKNYAVLGTAAPGAGASLSGPGLTGATDAWAHGSSFDVGLTYTFGPAVVGVTYFQGESRSGTALAGGGAGRDHLYSVSAGGRYQLGPGVQVQANVFHDTIRSDSFAPTNNGASAGFNNNKANGVTTAILLNF